MTICDRNSKKAPQQRGQSEEGLQTKLHTEREETYESHLQKFSGYNNRKAVEQQSKEMIARQAALDAMGMPVEQQEFGFEDHKALYNYAQERAPFNQPPIKNIDASVALPVGLPK